MRKKPAMPKSRTTEPMTPKIKVQVSGWFWSKPIKPPKTTRIAISGIIALMPSAAPLFVASVESVSQALKQASFAQEPKKVITQSMMMTRLTPIAAAEAAAGNSAPITSVRIRAKLQMEIPHRI